ncbi:8a8b1b14-a14e-4b28-b6f3-20a2e868261a [Thermothielavioides terrestris]|jgi:hypothetical protein|uniref:MOSC domain-containing protein n=2 Tax=Thermothielavioides terrestris TaxID=2587410 RepID=G2R6G4_THETT|nr:uncharacterized protein THITE_2116527 [Thermothielavioides terrestris NRRL 8126]AEO67649.1 hypothetical protein THITE_2116527 [Thermothielavioides terrestris NRRL 8126]SPQ25776.1 8a8b1b14-a14e-4b28-b6f3-20a2e868261a [Thermothielavioides terrestris]
MSVHAVALSATHEFSKTPAAAITLLAGLGVQGDCHSGVHVQHRSRQHLRPRPPNLRQVHLLARETLAEVGVAPGQLGENVTTAGVDLLALGRGTRLHFLPAAGADADAGEGEGGEAQAQAEGHAAGLDDPHAVVVVQGLRNPCPQIDKFREGLKERFIVRDAERRIVGRKAGVMGTVEVGGEVSVGMRIVVEKPATFEPLECV